MCIYMYIYKHKWKRSCSIYIYNEWIYIYEYVYDTSFLSIHLVKGCLGCFPVSTIENTSAVNIGVYISFLFELVFYLDICPVVGSLDYMVTLFLIF